MGSGVRKLRIAFESAEAFQREFDSNLSNGGVFVRSQDLFELREAVIVELVFDYSDRSIALDGEVVHIVPVEMAEMGGVPGVAVQFQMPTQELRERLGEMATSAAIDPHKDDGARGAQRKAVHVEAQIQADHEVVSGETRNLSLTGVLVGVGGHSVPLGEKVSLMLQHPTTRERRSIEGRVVRQVESAGEIAALAVEFTNEGNDREETERFVEELQNAEHTRRLGGISGPIEELGPQSLLQMFATTAPAGTLVLRSGQQEGVICFESGLLRLAQLGSTTGMKALVRMLSWRDGTFEFQARIDDRHITGAPFPLEAALLDAVRQIDEVSQVDRGRFSLQARLVRSVAADVEGYGTLTKVEGAVLDLAAAGFTIQRALEVIPEPDPEIFRALQALTDAGLLELVS